MHKLRVEMTGAGRGRVWMDDFELQGVRAVRTESEVHRANTATLELFVETVEYSGPVDAALMAKVMRGASVKPKSTPHWPDIWERKDAQKEAHRHHKIVSCGKECIGCMYCAGGVRYCRVCKCMDDELADWCSGQHEKRSRVGAGKLTTLR